MENLNNGEKMNRWKRPSEWPRNGSVVAILHQHWKQHKYMSSAIEFGEVNYSNDGKSWMADTIDMSGMGSYCPSKEGMVAWAYAEDIDLPDWLPHNQHWGELKENKQEER